MPGCGKSKTCRYLGEITNYKIIDLDKYIEEKVGDKVADIFSKYGETYFRQLEHVSLEEISKSKSNIIVSCGGGIVTNLLNKEVMRPETTVFLDASIDVLNEHLTNSDTIRPLLKEKSIEEIYNERILYYQLFADYTIKYTNYIDAANKILEIISGVHKKKVLVVNGPNINMLGLRDPKHYGTMTLEDLNGFIARDKSFDFDFFQSNCEGAIIDKLQTYHNYAGIIINPAAYTHTSVAIHDCLEAISIPKVEVHLSDVNNREEYRKINFISDVCNKTFSGRKEISYLEAVEYLKNIINVL
jgi:3-dehydroquinate dehydratase-2